MSTFKARLQKDNSTPDVSLSACVTDTPVTLCLDSKAETAGSVVLVLMPESVPALQQDRQRVSLPCL